MLMQTSRVLTTDAATLYKAFAKQLTILDFAPGESLLLPFTWQQPYRNPHRTVLRGQRFPDCFLASVATVELEGGAPVNITTSPVYEDAYPINAIRKAGAYSLLPFCEIEVQPLPVPDASLFSSATDCAGMPLYRSRVQSALNLALA